MATYRPAVFTLAQLLRWNEEGELILQPKFQRRLAWKPEARAYLIDTIVRGLPMPKIYLRRTHSPDTMRSTYEVVDGQQRLDAIISFRRNDLSLSKKLSPDYGNVTFDLLSDNLQRQFLQYEVSTELMEDASDMEVLGMFERLNTYTLALNAQEIRNARYFGYFKQTAYRLAAQQTESETWQKLQVFSDQQIARMREVELTSDVLAAIVAGVNDIAFIGKAYAQFDNEFPKGEAASASFRGAMSFVTQELSQAVRMTRFRNRAWFYSLLVAVADASQGIPGGMGPAPLQPGMQIANRMLFLHEALKPVQPPKGLAHLRNSLSRATSHRGERLTRHEHFFKMATLPSRSWDERWSKLTHT